MGFDIKWLKEGHVLVVTADEHLDDEDASAFNDVLNEYFEASSRVLVHGIFDFSKANRFFSLKSMARFTFPKHSRMGWNLFIGIPNKQIAFLISIATQIFKVRARNFNTMEEAVDFIKWVDKTVENDNLINEIS